MPNIYPFHSTMSHFRVTSQFWMTQNYLDMFKIKSIYMHTTFTSEVQLSFFSLYDEPQARRFWVKAQFLGECTKWPQMISTCSRSKIPTCILHTPLRTKFLSILLYDEPFLSYGPIFGKVNRITPNDLDMFKCKKIPTCMLHTPPRHKFLSVSLYDEPFLSYGPIFGKVPQMTPNDIDLLKVKKYQHACYIHPRGLNFCPFRSTISRF